MGFRDPIVAGDTLVRQAIQSDNFVAGSAGWRIRRIGDAEFNDLIMRGEVTLEDGSGNVLQLTLDTRPIILFHDDGVPNNPYAQIDWLNVDAGSDVLSLTCIGQSGDSAILRLNGGTLSGGAYIAVNQEIVTEGENWHDVVYNTALAVDWSNFGSPHSNVQYRWLPHGYVGLRGVATLGTKTDFSVGFTLPTGYRPVADKLINVRGNSAGATPSVAVAPNGNVSIFNAGATTTIGFDGLSFELGTI